MSDADNGLARLVPPFMVFIRHGQTDWNAEGRMQGRRDIPLNDTGRTQARRNGAALRDYFAEKGIDPGDLSYFVSPLSRAVETMTLVCEEMDLDPDLFQRDERLLEITFGAWEGFTIPELAERAPALAAARKADKWGFVPPEGESYRMLSSRIDAWMVTLTRPSVVISHGGVMRVLQGRLLSLPNQEIPGLDIPQDRMLVWTGSSVEWI
jgi:probable phosphoglycerate mutase